MAVADILLGSNIAPEENIARALRVLRQRFTVLAETDVLRTVALGPDGEPSGQADFLNAIVRIEDAPQTEDAPRTGDSGRAEALRATLRQIERAAGRVRSADAFAPRVLDLDILRYDGTITDPADFSRPFVQQLVAQL